MPTNRNRKKIAAPIAIDSHPAFQSGPLKRRAHRERAELAASFHAEFAPSSANERVLVDCLAENAWRLRYLRSVEARVARDADDAIRKESQEAVCAALRGLLRLQRVIDSCEDNYYRALQALQRFQSKPVPEKMGSFGKTLHTTPESPEAA